jgi:hypothetical protein
LQKAFASGIVFMLYFTAEQKINRLKTTVECGLKRALISPGLCMWSGMVQ